MKTVPFVSYLLLCAGFVFFFIKVFFFEKSWNEFKVKNNNVVQEDLRTQNSHFFVLNNIK
jgi:hypothetical protein